jgi:hypothetical protein
MRKLVPHLTILLVMVLGNGRAAADGRSEAADRFDRGVQLFNEGDNAGALLEFRRAHQLSGEARILLNVGLVYAEMKRPVEAVAALDKILEQPAGLTPAQIGRARQARDEQAAQIGTLTVTTNVPAQIEIDNLMVGRTPLGGPLRVAAGLRRLAVVAPGHAPLHQEVPVSGGQEVALKLDLQPIQGTLAQLKVHSTLPGADVLVDGKLVGHTPMASSLALAPGRYEVSVRRAGYRGPKRDIDLVDGATGELTLEPEEDPEQAV